VAFSCCSGYLSDGQPAKLPTKDVMALPSWPSIEHEFADMETVVLRVACLLKFYGQLTKPVAEHFVDLMELCFSEVERLIIVNFDARPAHDRPLSPFFRVPENRPCDFGEFLLHCHLPAAKSFSRRMLDASWASLSIAAKVQCIYVARSEGRDRDESFCAEFRPKRRRLYEAIRGLEEMPFVNTVDDEQDKIPKILERGVKKARLAHEIFENNDVSFACADVGLGLPGLMARDTMEREAEKMRVLRAVALDGVAATLVIAQAERDDLQSRIMRSTDTIEREFQKLKVMHADSLQNSKLLAATGHAATAAARSSMVREAHDCKDDAEENENPSILSE
jgi:hypothetical protein